MTASTILSIISGVLALARWLVGYAEQKKWMEAGAAEATLKGLQDADEAIKAGNEARAAARATHTNDPASILRDDDGFKRPD
ncbi:hypothetical protein V1290_000066 [Bradyrhizobium sp. AZCC 1578]|uniref:hypothetical protein n=1 Tax=Bradyrhizobium sp. AZCC 1578 TaxID=3117027 RepID=UPI002FF14BEF